jgi:hypothetical protein
MNASHMTLKEALETNRLDDFIAQAEWEGFGLLATPDAAMTPSVEPIELPDPTIQPHDGPGGAEEKSRACEGS